MFVFLLLPSHMFEPKTLHNSVNKWCFLGGKIHAFMNGISALIRRLKGLIILSCLSAFHGMEMQ